MTPNEYDGLYFLPGDEEDELELSYFHFSDDEYRQNPTIYPNLGNMYHIAFFKRGIDGKPAFDETFDAVLLDPKIYVTGLIGCDIYGCLVKKTKKSTEWFNDYLENTKKNIMITRLKDSLESILESKEGKKRGHWS
jgi:hypothetical protein